MRAPTDAQRDALVADVMSQLDQIAERRGVRVKTELTMSAAAAPSAPEWQAHWERAVRALGVPLFKLPSGAGHDAMKLHEVMPQAMLFVRGENGGISHNPRESTTSDDMQLCVDAFTHVLNQLSQGTVMSAPTVNHSQQYAQLDAWIDAHFDEQVKFMQALVQVPTDTPPGNNAPHAERTAELLAPMGFDAEKHPVPASEVKAYGLESVTNLIVRRNTARAKPLP
jgi:acetylornithine deacetylase/succinyl-diaminopimelate desuccinylase-like protein